MGCWNETCRLSHLQIMSGNKVEVIILIKNNDMFNPWYYNTNYAPLCLPIEGEYDDYGGIENAIVADYTMNLLKTLNIVDEEDDAYTVTTIEQLVEDITSSNLYLKHNDKKCRLECAFYHKKLYDKIIRKMRTQKPYNHEETLFKLYTNKYKRIEKDIEKIKAIQASMTDVDKLDKKNIESLDENKKISMKAAELWLARSSVEKKLYKTSEYGYSFPVEYIDVLKTTEVKEYHKDLINYIMFSTALRMGRYGFNTVAGAGGQDNNTMVQMLVAEFILSHCKKRQYTTENEIMWFDK